MPYIIKSQGYDPSRPFLTKKEAVTLIKKAVKVDKRDCRRRFGTAVTQCWDNDMWEVRPLQDRQGPLWSRYTLHEI